MLFQATAQKVQATLLSVLRKGILDIPLMFVFNGFRPLYGVAQATPVAEIIGCVTAIVLMIAFFKKHAKYEKAQYRLQDTLQGQ